MTPAAARGSVHGEALRAGVRAAGREQRELAQRPHGLPDGEERDDGAGTEDGGEEAAAFERSTLGRRSSGVAGVR